VYYFDVELKSTLCSDNRCQKQIAALRHFMIAGDLAEPFDDIVNEDDTNLCFIQVLCVSNIEQFQQCRSEISKSSHI